MAGFMSGFGKGFSSAFQNTQAILADRRKDAFRVAYDQFTANKAKYDAEDSKWQKAVKAGELMVSQLGPNVPPQASIKAAEFLMAGYSLEDTEEKMRAAQFTVKPEEITLPETPGIDQQMQQSGMAPETPMNPANDLMQPQHDQPIMDGIRTLFPNAGLSPEEKAARAVQEGVGIDEAEFNKINSGFSQPDTSYVEMTPNAAGANPLAEFGMEDGITPAKLQAAKVTVAQWEKSDNPDEKAKAARFRALEPDITVAAEEAADPADKAAVLDLLKPSATARQEVSEQISAAKTVAQQGMVLDQMVQAQPEILTVVAQGSSLYETIKTEGQALLNLVTDLGSKNVSEAEMLQQVMPEVDRVAQSLGTPELARQYREFTAAKIRYIYAVGKSLGQQGNGFSNADYINISNSVFTSNEPGAFSANMKRIARERLEAVDNSIGQLGTMAEIAGALEYAPELKPLLAPVLMPMEQQMAGDPVLAWMGEQAAATTAPPSGNTPAAPKDTLGVQSPMPQSAIDAGITPEMWAIADEEEKAAFQ